MEQPPGNKTGNEPVSFLRCSKDFSTNSQNTEQHKTTTPNKEMTTLPLNTATPLIEEGLMRDDQTNELYLPLTSTVVLKRKQEMLYVPPDFENNHTLDALVDSGAFVSAIAQDDLETIKQKASNNTLKIDDPPNFQIQVANGQLEKPLSTATLKFEIGDNSFAEHFVVMKKLTGPIIGLHFMRNNSVVIDTTHGLIHFQHLTMQVKTAASETTTKLQPVIMDADLTIPPATTKTVTAFINHPSKWNTTGTVTPLEKFTETASLLISHSMSTIIDKRIAVRVTNTTESPYLIKKHTQIAEFSVVTPEQSKHIKPVDMAILSIIPQDDPDMTAYLNELLRTNKSEQQDNTFWFLTPENPGKPEDHTPIQTRILKELNELKDKEKLNPRESTESRNKFLERFDWTDTLLTETEKQAIEDILVEYHDIFARHRMDIGMNTEFKVKLTPKDDKAVYSQSLPMPIHLKEDLIVELALMHKYGIITVLPFSKYASPIFAQRKPNGKLRLLVDLRKINSLIADDYTNNNHPVSTMSDAAQHLAGKSLFCKLDCSQAYHCLQMADQRSVELLAFNFASRTFAYRRLAQGLSRSVSAFSSFMREYLDPVVKADQCAQYVDDIGIAANNATDLTRKIRAVFKCIRQAGLKLTIEKCHFGVRQVEFLGRTISPEGISPQARKIQNFLAKLRFPKSKKALQRYLGFVNYYRNYIPRMAEKLNPFYKLLKTEVPINITSELKETFDSVNTALSDACELALKQPIPGKQLVLMTDASFRSAGYALMIEDNPDQKIQSKRKTYAPVAFGSKIFSPAQLKMSIYSKEFLAIYMAFLEFAHILWEATKPTIVLTDNKSVTRFFQTKAIPPALWNACDYVLQFNFKIAHIAGSVNTAADFLSRLELKVTEKIRLKIREDIQTTPIEVTTSSSDVADEEQIFFTSADGAKESEEQTLERKEQSRQNAKQWAANKELLALKTSVKEFTKIDGNTTSYSMNGIKANARIRVEQDVDLGLKNLKLKILGQPFDEVLLMTDSRYKNYKANEDRIILKDGLLYRKYFGETGSVKYYQILIPKQLVKEILRSLHGEFGKHPGIFKTIIACREKYYFPKMAQLIREWVMSCEQCIRESRIHPNLTRPPLQNPNEHITAPEDAIQIDLVPELPPSGGYQNIVTAMDVFSRYLFAYPTANQDAYTIAKVLINIMTKHAYLPTTLISDKGTAFTSHVIKEVAGVLGVTLKHATTKHAQTIGLLERSHASIKKALKIETGERRSLWHKYVNIAVLNYNTSYHTSIGCEPSRVFHGRIPYNILDLKLGIRPQQQPIPTSQIAQDILEQTEMIHQDVRKNTMQAYIKYKAYYDKKANASKLKEADYVYILQPKADHQGSKIPFTEFRWVGPYIVEKVLPNNNYLVRKIGTNKTQLLHRMRMRQFTPRQPPADITVKPHEYKSDPEVSLYHDDLYARAWEYDFEQPIFDAENDSETPPNQREIQIQSDLPTEETRNTQGTTHQRSPEIFPPTDEINDVADTYTHVEPDVGTSLEQQQSSPSNPRSAKYNLRHNPKPNCNDDYRY